MLRYFAVQGIEHDEDNSVSLGQRKLLYEGGTLEKWQAEVVLRDYLNILGITIESIPMGLFRHVPGVECAFQENSVGNNRIWLIKSVDVN